MTNKQKLKDLFEKYDVVVGVRKNEKIDIDIEKQKEEVKIENEIISIYNYFYSNLNNVDAFFKLNNDILKDVKSRKDKILNKFLKNNRIDGKGNEYILGLSKDEFIKFHSNREEKLIIGSGNTIISKSMLIYFHSLFETFLSKILHLIYINSPEQFNDNNIKFTFLELKDFNSIDDAKKYIINQKISNILYSSIERQFETLFNLLGRGNLNKEDKFPIKELIEISIRRNLFTHEDGIVNDIYINKCKEYGIQNNFKKGQKIIFEDKYFETVYKIYYEFSIKIIYFTWLKLSKDDEKYDDVAGSFINNRIFSMIKKDDLELGLKISDFILSSKCVSKLKEATKLMLLLNKALIYKKMEDNDKVKDILKNIDWTAKSNLFMFAKNILSEEWEEAGKLMKKVIKKGVNQLPEELGDIELKTWPLFFQFRKEEIFKKNYKKIFGNDFIMDF